MTKPSPRPFASHELKAEVEPFEAMWKGEKLHEFRRDDRGFFVGDELVLREWLVDGARYTNRYTNRQIFARVTYVSRGPAWGIPVGFVAMSVRVIAKVLR